MHTFAETHHARIVFANGGGGGCAPPPTPPLFLSRASLLQSICHMHMPYAHIFGNPSCENRVCKWGGAAPPPTPPLSQAMQACLKAYAIRICHMHTFSETHHARIVFANGGGLRPPQPPAFSSRASLPQSICHMHTFSETHHARIVFANGGGCPPPTPRFPQHTLHPKP